MVRGQKNFGPTTATRRARCGICEACQQTDCGKCSCCRDMVKFGESGRTKKSCVSRKCPNMAVQLADDDDELVDADIPDLEVDNLNGVAFDRRTVNHHTSKNIEWVGPVLKIANGLTFYSAAMVNGERIFSGCHVTIEPEDARLPMYVAKVVSLWKEGKRFDKCMHVRWFCRATDTVLGETCGDPTELFLIEYCKDLHLSAVVKTVNVKYKPLDPVKWKSECGRVFDDPDQSADVDHHSDTTFWYRYLYRHQTGRFEEPPPIECPDFVVADNIKGGCYTCDRLAYVRQREVPKLGPKLEKGGYSFVIWHDMEIHVGDALFLEPDVYVERVKSKGEMNNSDIIGKEGNVVDGDYNEEV